VRRASFDELEPALEAARRAADEVQAEGRLDSVSMVREYEPAERVAARIEIAYGGVLRGRSAGVDVMGDGSMVGFSGGVRRRELEPRGSADVFDLVARELGSVK
jgi:hypothetical protein